MTHKASRTPQKSKNRVAHATPKRGSYGSNGAKNNRNSTPKKNKYQKRDQNVEQNRNNDGKRKSSLTKNSDPNILQFFEGVQYVQF